jgi:hypothetical protein
VVVDSYRGIGADGQERAEQWAEHCQQREEEDRRHRVMVIAEFDAGGPEATLHAMAAAALHPPRLGVLDQVTPLRHYGIL